MMESLIDKLVLISNVIGDRIDEDQDTLSEKEFLGEMWHWINELINQYGEEE